MSIGNSINSLPLAYAPLNGTGRYVAYALASPTAEAVATPLPSFVVDPGTSLTVSGGVAPVGLKTAPASVTAATSAGTSIQGARNFFGSVSAAITAVIAGSPQKLQLSALAALAGQAAIPAAVPLRIRQGASDFSSLYTPPGVRSSGPALNTFALNLAALNSRAGQHYRTFEVLFTPVGALGFSASSSLEANTEQAPTGNVLFGGFSNVGSAASISPLPNAVFDPNPSLAVLAGAAPFGSALRGTGGTFDQTLAALTALGNFTAGPTKTLAGASASTFSASTVFSALSGVSIAGSLTSVAMLLADGIPLPMEALAAASILGGRLRIGEIDVEINSAMDGVPWWFLPAVISTVYANSWDKSLGFVINEDTVFLTTLESVVYRPTLESIVYGEIE